MKIKNLKDLHLDNCVFTREGTDYCFFVEGYEVLKDVIKSCEKYSVKKIDYIIFSKNEVLEVTLGKVAFEAVKKWHQVAIEY